MGSGRPERRTIPDDGSAEAASAAQAFGSAEFEARVALEAIRGEVTVAQPMVTCGVHQTMIGAWKKQAIDAMSGVFSGRAGAVENASSDEAASTSSSRRRRGTWRPRSRCRRGPTTLEGRRAQSR
jgi:hypothetical protein